MLSTGEQGIYDSYDTDYLRVDSKLHFVPFTQRIRYINQQRWVTA